MADTEYVVKVTVADQGASSAVTGIVSAVEDAVTSFKSVEEAASKVVETVLKIIEAIQKMQEEVEKMRDGMEEAAVATAHQADAIDLANLKLQDQIAKLEGAHSNNGLSEALIAASGQAHALTQALDAALQKSNELLEKQSVGFLKSLFTGQEETKDLADKISPEFDRLKELRRQETLDIEEFQQKNHETELHGTEEQKKQLAQGLADKENAWNEEIRKVTDNVNQRVAIEQAAMEQEKKDRVTFLTSEHAEGGADGTYMVAALNQKEAESQVNEQYRVRSELLRELSVQATAYYQGVKGAAENLQEQLNADKAREDADKKAKAQQAAAAAQERLRADISNQNALLEAAKKVTDAKIKYDEEAIRVQVAEHKIGADQELKQEQDLLDKKLKADQDFLSKKLEQLNRDPTTNKNQITAVNGEIERLQVEHDTEMLKLKAKYDAEVEKNSKKQLKDEVDKVEEQVKSARAGSEERVRILDDEIKKLAGENKTDTEEYKRLINERTEAVREHAKQVEALEDIYHKAETQHEQALRDQQLSRLDFQRQMGQKSEAEYEQQLQAEITDTYNAAVKELEARKLRYKDDPIEYAKAEAELVKLTDKYNADIEKSDQKSYQRRQQQFDQYFKQISSGFNTALNSWMQGTESASQAFGKMFQSILSQLINFVEQWIEKKVEMWLMDKFLSETTQSTSAMSEITSNAAVAYSAAYASTAAIPFVGPGLAPEAAMAAYMDVMAMTPAGFALGGVVPATGLALVHQGERVLPASMSGTGDLGMGNVHVHLSVNAIDSDSFQHTIKRHGNMIGNEVMRVLKKRGMSAK